MSTGAAELQEVFLWRSVGSMYCSWTKERHKEERSIWSLYDRWEGVHMQDDLNTWIWRTCTIYAQAISIELYVWWWMHACKCSRCIFTTNPKPSGIPFSACSGTSSVENPLQTSVTSCFNITLDIHFKHLPKPCTHFPCQVKLVSLQWVMLYWVCSRTS